MANIAKALRKDLAAVDVRRPKALGPPKRPELLADLDGPQIKPWLRFTFRFDTQAEFGLFGRILAGLCSECRAFYFEPWPGNDRAVYLKNEGDNKARLVELAKEAGIRPVAFAEVDAP